MSDEWRALSDEELARIAQDGLEGKARQLKQCAGWRLNVTRCRIQDKLTQPPKIRRGYGNREAKDRQPVRDADREAIEH